MREIKFRGYDIKGKFLYNSVGFINFAKNTCQLAYTDDKNNCYAQVTRNIKNVILEQYTGITDDDGEEVYEGDIVRVYKDEYPDNHNTNYYDVPVAMEDGCYVVLHKNNELETLMDVYISNYTIKVIGNIHEGVVE